GGVPAGPGRKLNVSGVAEGQHGDNPLRVFATRDLASRAIGRRPPWTSVRQVHGARVVEASFSGRLEADGLWTDDDAKTLAVVSADCVLALVIGDGRIAVAHAGWRGMVGG